MSYMNSIEWDLMRLDRINPPDLKTYSKNSDGTISELL